MFVHHRQPWQLPEYRVTPERDYLNRRSLLKGGLLGLGASLGASLPAYAKQPRLDQHRYPLTAEEKVTNYVNFYEFGSHKGIADLAQAMPNEPWNIAIEGLVEREKILDLDDLRRTMTMEERITMHRCVEAWAFVAPWRGFPLRALIAEARPLAEARFVEFTTLMDETTMPGLAQDWYPWPYVEGLTLAEANNELAFLATGLYGKDLKPQNGAPIRLILPWKYGFKSIKSIVRIRFSAQQPVSFWQQIASGEYGFYANINPKVPHPRWSQASHRMLGSDERVKTELFNGYTEWVAGLYPGYQDQQRALFY